MTLREAMKDDLFPHECLDTLGSDPDLRGRCVRCASEVRLGDYVWEGDVWDGFGSWFCPTEGCVGELDEFEPFQVFH